MRYARQKNPQHFCDHFSSECVHNSELLLNTNNIVTKLNYNLKKQKLNKIQKKMEEITV